MTDLDVVLAGLAAGAGTGGGRYEALRAAVAARLSDERSLRVLNTGNLQPGPRRDHLAAALGEVDAHLVALARAVLASFLADRPGVVVHDAKGLQVGDHNTQHNTF
ncbi:hypothetical protein [Actinosynnema sp. NPDC020468]|uniref:hypothetical protein n=1 Tax=Actinosynnema sp. NPDC020468 TaxID=3154488 RepID=UPI0033FDB83C